MTKDRPSWYASRWRSSYNWDTNKSTVLHEKPIRCPYCGYYMGFHITTGYGSHSSDNYWICHQCRMSLPNQLDFRPEFLEGARKNYRKHLKNEMENTKGKFDRLKNLYNQYGVYFTKEEKRDRLIETIEEQGNKNAIQE